MKSRIILTDVDGVLLNWNSAFSDWMHARGIPMIPNTEVHYSLSKRHGLAPNEVLGLVREFNTSDAIANLPVLRDAEEYVKKLHHEHGFVFHAITSLSSDPKAHSLRLGNLIRVFGEGVVESLVCLETGSGKEEALLPYQGSNCYWIEDHTRNALAGHNLGLRSILVEHAFNSDFSHDSIPVVKTWKEIYEKVIRA